MGGVWPGSRAALPSKKIRPSCEAGSEAAEAVGCPEKGDDSLRKASAFREDLQVRRLTSRVRVTAWPLFPYREFWDRLFGLSNLDLCDQKIMPPGSVFDDFIS